MGVLGLRESTRKGAFANNAANFAAMGPALQKAAALGATEQSPLAVLMASLGVRIGGAPAPPRPPGIRATPPQSPSMSYKNMQDAAGSAPPHIGIARTPSAAAATAAPSSSSVPAPTASLSPHALGSTPLGIRAPSPHSPASSFQLAPGADATPPAAAGHQATATPATHTHAPSSHGPHVPAPAATPSAARAPPPLLTPASATSSGGLKSAMRHRAPEEKGRPPNAGKEWVTMSGTVSGGQNSGGGHDSGGGGSGGAGADSKLMRELRLQGIKEARTPSIGDAASPPPGPGFGDVAGGSGRGKKADRGLLALLKRSLFKLVVARLLSWLRRLGRLVRYGRRFGLIKLIGSIGDSVTSSSVGSWFSVWGSSGARTQRNMSRLRNEFINEIRVVVHLRHPNITTVRGGQRFQRGGHARAFYVFLVCALCQAPQHHHGATPFRRLRWAHALQLDAF